MRPVCAWRNGGPLDDRPAEEVPAVGEAECAARDARRDAGGTAAEEAALRAQREPAAISRG